MKERQFSVLIAAAAPEERATMRDALSRDPAIHYVVIEAESGFRALELCRARRPDCLILDHDLPDLSALETLKKLAAEEGMTACAVVVLISAGDMRLAVEVMESGAHGCLEKNRAGGEELLRAVSDAIEAERRRQFAEHESMTVGAARLAAKAAVSTGSAAGLRPKPADHKRAEEQLRLLKTAIEQSNESVMIMTAQLDPPGPLIVYVNSAFTKMTGYAPEEVIGKTPRILDGPKTDRAVLDQLRKDCAAGKVFRGKTIKYRKDGSEFHLEWTAGPVRNERGEVTHLVATQRDVTEPHRIEEALRRSEEEFRSLFDMSAIGMAQVSRDYKFLRVNHKLCQMLGYSEQELLRLTFLDATYPDDREVSAAQASACFAGEMVESNFEKRYVRKDGEVIWALVNWTSIPEAEGLPLRTVTSIQDITERKRAEAEREQLARELAARAEAEQMEEKIRRLQAVIDVALAHYTLDDLLHEMLVRIRELLETDYDAILLSTEDQQSLVVSSTIGLDEGIGIRIPVGRGVAGSIAAIRAPLIVEDLSAVEVVNPVLRRMVHSLVGAPLIAEGRLIGVIHADTARARHFTEDDVRLLQLAADRIALAIEQRRLYEVERQARRQAEEANRSKDEFLSVVSHELRTPLNAILGYARLLRRGPQDPQGVERAAEVIERNGMAQSRLIDDLLDTASIISGKLRLEIGPVDLASVIEEAVQTIRPAADAKGVSLQAELPPEVGQITGDPIRLRQVVWNLVSNAVKFTPQGGRVEVRLERIDPHICITVSDTGKGINAEFLPDIFDRFRQADASIKRRHSGLGLGLSLVKYLVELHGGTIDVASEGEGRGTTFKILLPVRAVATPLGEAEGEPVIGYG